MCSFRSNHSNISALIPIPEFPFQTSCPLIMQIFIAERCSPPHRVGGDRQGTCNSGAASPGGAAPLCEGVQGAAEGRPQED